MHSSNWHLIVCGTSHKVSSLKEREPLQVNGDEIAAAHAAFSDLADVREATILSTCNRVEFYFVTRRKVDPFEVVAAYYARARKLDVDRLREKFYVKKGRHAADHLFRVAAGIESMVLGENQILGQVRDAYSSACAVKAAGKIIHRLFHQAFRVGKQIRTDTEMGKGACSVSSAAMDLLRTKIDGLESARVLFVGINQMIQLAAGNLRGLDNVSFWFTNRTEQKAADFAAGYGARGFGLEQLPRLLPQADIIVTCTGATLPVITSAMLNTAARSRPDKRLVVVDMAVPRDVDCPPEGIPGCEVYDLEDIKAFVAEQQRKRQAAIPQVERIVERRLDEFVYWYEHVLHEPIYNGVGDVFERVRLDEVIPLLDRLSQKDREVVDRATRRLTQKLMQLRLHATEPDR